MPVNWNCGGGGGVVGGGGAGEGRQVGRGVDLLAHSTQAVVAAAALARLEREGDQDVTILKKPKSKYQKNIVYRNPGFPDIQKTIKITIRLPCQSFKFKIVLLCERYSFTHFTK